MTNTSPSPGGAFDFSDLGRLSRLVDRNLAPGRHRIKLFLHVSAKLAIGQVIAFFLHHHQTVLQTRRMHC